MKIERDLSNPAFVLIPDELAATIPPLHTSEKIEDPIACLKFFTPDSSWTWYLVEYDPDQQLAFGLVSGHERELGYFSIEELVELRGPMGLPIERDLYFAPKPISKCQ